MSKRMLNVGLDEDEDEVASTKSGQSVADYEGDLKQIPPTMYFGDELCRALFVMTAIGDVVHVCGNGRECVGDPATACYVTAEQLAWQAIMIQFA
jgi:hypothetical protein